jgi:hypothetical protein
MNSDVDGTSFQVTKTIRNALNPPLASLFLWQGFKAKVQNQYLNELLADSDAENGRIHQDWPDDGRFGLGMVSG